VAMIREFGCWFVELNEPILKGHMHKLV